MESISRKRINWIDYLRCLAILCVVLCHITESVFYLSFDNYLEISGNHNLPLILFAIGRLGVPFFLLISGYLLLDKEYSDKKCTLFWKKKVFHLWIIFEVWLLIFFIWDKLYENMQLSFVDLLREILFLRLSEMGQMWYLPTILGIYLFIPFITIVLHKADKKHIKILLCICILYLYGVPTLNILLNIFHQENVATQLSLDFSGGIYGCYLIVGYLIKKDVLKKIKNVFLIIISFISFVIVCALEIFSYRNGNTCNIWYDCLFLFISGVCIFELCSRLKLKSNKVIEFGAKYSFGVYLTHNMVRSFIMKNIVFDNINKIAMIVIYEILVIVISYIVTFAISKIPKIGKYILYIK